MTENLEWLDEDLENYGAVKLTETDPIVEPVPSKVPSVAAISSPKLSLKDTFQIDTPLVISRLKKAFWPFYTGSFFEDLPFDLYSPFWITTTLILLISASNSFEYKSVSVLISSATLIYSLLMIVPAIVYCLLFHNGSSSEYYMIVSIYGYSLLQFIFPAALGGFLVKWAKWPLWTVAGGLSLKFLHQNIYHEIEKVMQTKKLYVVGVAILGHLCLVVLGNMYF